MESQCDRRQPSQVTDDAWLLTYRQQQNYPCMAKGKWLIYATRDKIDNLWKIVTLATEEGCLGSFSKVSTANLAYTAQTGVHLICVYTYDSEDHDDIMRVRSALYDLGITHPIYYEIWNGQQMVKICKK